jgi:hypothetical protein
VGKVQGKERKVGESSTESPASLAVVRGILIVCRDDTSRLRSIIQDQGPSNASLGQYLLLVILDFRGVQTYALRRVFTCNPMGGTDRAKMRAPKQATSNLWRPLRYLQQSRAIRNVNAIWRRLFGWL